MANNVYGNDELNCTDEPAESLPARNIEVVIPDAEITGATPPLM
jgi:hypothetical protein